MAEKTAISWTDHTFNPWWGCQKVSPACDHCYAERDAKRFAPDKVLWGVGSERRLFGHKHWQEPLTWARLMPAKLGRRPRVFCASMADWLDLDAPLDQFVALLDTIRLTPELDWLLLTKRIGNFGKRMRAALERIVETQGSDCHLAQWLQAWLDGKPPEHVILMATVIDQAEADRDVVKLLRAPARRRGLSLEPLLGPVDLRRAHFNFDRLPRVDWVIAGGESGPHARPVHPDWIRSLRDQCAAAGVAFHLKQHGEWIACETEASTDQPGRAVYPDDGYGVDLGDGRRYQTTTAHGREFVRVGKAAAGRTLDGRQHDGFPA